MAQTGLNTAKNGLSENQMAAASARMAKSPCPKCGARRIDSQLGLEPTYQEYVANMVEVFREVRRVLRNDGTLWLNLGDSYAGRGHGGGGSYDAERNWRQGAIPGEGGQQNGSRNRDGLGRIIGLKPKDLCGIPWRVAFALQADGWYLRQDIIWSKPNPMPESVRDRCTKAHEYIFLLSKGARYYYDAEAIAEDSIRPGDVQTFGGAKACHSEILEGDPRFRNGAEQWGRTIECGNTRNRRSVWEIAIAPFSEAHFATFPPALIEPCIMAGCPKDGTVFDPFGGAGTTGLVADRLGRNAILIELNPEYAEMAEHRIKNDAGMFAEVTCGPIR
jgi:DNA modification methylase